MSDEELVKRLLDFDKMTVGDARDAALRIEALSAERDAWKGQYAAEALGLHVQMQRADALQAKLAKAVEALQFYADLSIDGPWHLPSEDYGKRARALLAEIEGEKG